MDSQIAIIVPNSHSLYEQFLTELRGELEQPDNTVLKVTYLRRYMLGIYYRIDINDAQYQLFLEDALMYCQPNTLAIYVDIVWHPTNLYSWGFNFILPNDALNLLSLNMVVSCNCCQFESIHLYSFTLSWKFKKPYQYWYSLADMHSNSERLHPIGIIHVSIDIVLI